MAERPLDFTVRLAEERDRLASVELYRRSQEATGIPDPRFVPSELLGQRLYEGGRYVVRRYVAEHEDRLVGHALVELPNLRHITKWTQGTKLGLKGIVELGRAFVDPEFSGNGIWTELLKQRLRYVETELSKTAVAATWIQNDHVKQVFESLNATHVGDTRVADGEVSLYRFDRSRSLVKENGQEVAVVGVNQDQEQDEVEEQVNAQ